MHMAVMDGEPLGDVASGRLLSVLFLEVNKCMLLFHVHIFVELRAFTIVNVYALYTRVCLATRPRLVLRAHVFLKRSIDRP